MTTSPDDHPLTSAAAPPTRPAPVPPPKRPRPTEGAPPYGFPTAPGVHKVKLDDLYAALREGAADFQRAPKFGLFFGGVYAAGGLALLACLTIWDTPWAIIPLAISFPLVGPFIAVGLYEVSRRLSSGQALNWASVLGVVAAQRDRQLSWMALVMLFVFWLWAYQVRLLLALFLSTASISSWEGFVMLVATTPNGWTFLAIGTAIGAVLYVFLFSITVISMPLLLERDLDIVTALATSVTVVRRSPVVMLIWAVVVMALMTLALAPAFLGLVIVLPVLGHATWRLYERAVAWG